ncbi:acetyl-CoA C-acetyltransferase [Solibacillus sp. FSL W7-1472]|uniref:acetyl-CoA C-acyltransferase n=2 Tax=Solibacillus TaxID=648800 RepID=F2F6L4_SOLSS|nr:MULTISPECIES: acetyl-CoA C-acetyltransferase [Solibacillus]AMO86503.1 acetyl-CoA acetyltransferase [Solibacillus silvestris]EKB43515.1 3-ketoacyl-CoA thiolase [Solibacillus isronensis B3W22]MCM3722771.1 acetyl-CoA C-acetyltransferase [Solibacillus isronensis]OBW57227.1 acetyl-CoA acetyltransferase [Solibacillus silvestris]BAK15456.1 acetyl-CoA acetyltransferase [Solibacillus silvestris StLB046]
MREAVIVAGARTPIGRAKKGSLANTRPDDFGAVVVKEALKRAGYEGPVDDLIMGCAMPEAEQGMNVARLVGALAGLPDETPALTVNRFCSSGLQTIAYAAERIMLGHAKAIVAGGTESMSMIPMTGNTVRLNPKIAEEAPQYYIGMGHTAEEVANRYNVTREEQDAFAVRSHELAEKAIKEGKFKDEIVPVEVTEYYVDENNQLKEKVTIFDTDEGVRPGTSVETLAKLRPAFNVKGSVTAGNASQTSDGAAAVLVMDREEAEKQGMQPLAKFLGFAVGGVPPEVMGIGPIVAVPKALEIAGITQDQVDLWEINEAFASQSIQVVRELGIDMEKVNVNGGAIALGHPLGATGAILTVKLINELKRRGGKYGVVTMCIGGGMGAAGVFEVL